MAFFPELQPRIGAPSDAWPDDASTYFGQLKYWLNAAYEEAEGEQKQSEDLKEVNKYIDYLGSKQWPETRPLFKSRATDNRTFRLFWELIGLLTDIKPVISVKSMVSDRKTAVNQQEILNKALAAWWLNTQADL